MEVEGDYKRELHKKFAPKFSKDPLFPKLQILPELSQGVFLAPHLTQSVLCSIFGQNPKLYDSLLCFSK